MELTRIRALRGPNLWGKHTAIEALVSCEENEKIIKNISGFETRLRERFPQLGPIRTFNQADTVSLAHALEVCTRDLQAQAGCPVTFSRTTPTEEAGTYQVVVEYSEEPVGKKAFDHAIALIEAALKADVADAWVEKLKAAGVPCGKINTVAGALADPHTEARKMVETVEHPTIGALKMLGIPFKFSDTECSVRMPPPLLGQHTDEVLAELGYDAAAIADLRRRAIV